MAEDKKEKEVTENVVAEADALPKTIVRRVVKEKLCQLSTDSDISVLRDSLQAFSESARIFIHYLSSTANDICKESNRQIINAEDVFKALEEIEFPEFTGPLRASLEEFRQKNAARRSASSKGKEISSKAKDTSSKGKDISSKAKDTSSKANGASSKAKDKSLKAKDANKKAKRKEPPTPSEGRKKRHEVENGDKDSD